MKKLTQEELDGIIESHEKWLRDEEDGEKADLSYKDLSGLDLSGADLANADLARATLTNADLADADLAGANLYGADLTGVNFSNLTNLTKADLTNADLTEADLTGANLARSNLTNATLTDAILTKADLTNADLTEADLTGTILTGTTLTGTTLTEANLTGATLPEFQIPQDEDLVVWKKLREYDTHKTILCKLLIPAGVARTATLTGNKCRAAKAKMLEFQDLEGNILDVGKVAHRPYNGYQRFLIYTKDAEVVPDEYDPDIREECTHGIHFFMTREEACRY